MSYSWYNVAAAYNNNTFQWQKTGEAWKTLTLPDGMYDYTDLNCFLQTQSGFVDPAAAGKKHVFNLYFDYAITWVVIGVATGYELDPTTGDFGKLLGFDKKVLKDATTFTATGFPTSREASTGCSCIAT